MIEVNLDDCQEILVWLDKNVQENMHPNLEKYNFSAVGRFAEWRSKDNESWIIKISGFPPKAVVTIKDDEMKMLFILRWT